MSAARPSTARAALPRARLLAAVVAAVLAAAVLLAACGGDGKPAEPLPAVGASIESVVTEDGLTLDARLFSAGAQRLVILLHMYPADQRSWYDMARELQGAGTSALTLDFRGYGASDGPQDAAKIDLDVRAALTFARERGYERVVLAGASMGGTAAIIAAAGQGGVDGVAALSAPARFSGLDARDAARRLDAPLLVIAARGDISAKESLEAFVDLAGLGAGRALLVDGRAHGTDMLAATESPQARERLLAFLDEVWGE